MTEQSSTWWRSAVTRRAMVTVALLVPWLIAAQAPAQTAINSPAPAVTNSPPELSEESAGATWSFSASVYGYLVPDSRDYVQPTFAADRDWLHLEARYNYEDLETGLTWSATTSGAAKSWRGNSRPCWAVCLATRPGSRRATRVR